MGIRFDSEARDALLGSGELVSCYRGPAPIDRQNKASGSAVALSLTLQPGQDGLLNVNITSNNNDSLAGFLVSYQINAPGLEFFTVAPGQPDDLQLTNPNYVFFGNSSAVNSNTPAGTITSVNFNNDAYSGLDTTWDSTGVVIPSSAGVGTLLTTLHVVATRAVPGDRFTISVDPTQSFFDDANYNSIMFTSWSGEVVIPTTSTVPEPGTLLLAISGIVSGFCVRKIKGHCRRHP